MRRQILPDELDYLFNRIGTAIWHLQNVEGAIVPFIIVKGIAKELNSLPKRRADELEAKYNKMTLGQLIGQLTNLALVEETLLKRLKTFNSERKWIVHNSVRESGDHLYTLSGRNNFFIRVEAFIEEAISLHHHIGDLLTDYVVSKGASIDQINRIAHSEIRKLKGEA